VAPDTEQGLIRRIQTTLRRSFGLKRLRDGQQAVIQRVLQGRNTLAVMPTGAGKSLCYQLPALLLPGRTLVVSPLIALMKDQCDKLRELGVMAVQVNSAVDAEEAREADTAIEDGSARIVFTTPEKLGDPDFMSRLAAHPISLAAVDEAHCISHWGHDFRPAFLEIGPALKALGDPTVLALTATANQAVTDEISQQLRIPAAGLIHTGAYRANLHYRVEQVTSEDDKLIRTLALVRSTEGAGIVYAATVKGAETVYEALLAANESVGLYHGRLNANERHDVQDAFMSGRLRVMVATNAFGLGIDKADTRFVLHYQMPSGLDAYYQESGRAGRDGEPADCTLLFLRSDKAVQQFFLAGRYPTAEDVELLYQTLHEAPPQAAGWTIDSLQQAMDRPRSKLRVGLSLLRRKRAVTQDSEGHLKLLRQGLTVESLRMLRDAYRDRREQDQAMLERMVFYAQTGQCRWQVLLEHLEDERFERCNTCDNCVRMARHLAEPTVAVDAADAVGQAPQASTPARFSVGDRVQARRYGVGTVVAQDALTVTVEFAPGKRRCFSPDYVEPAAAPRARRTKAVAGSGAGSTKH
jgi:ATP-dependent DNA helicase RecQ